MSWLQLLLLVTAGLGAGLCASVAGLASLVSYPVLLAVGLSPLAANVTNTWALLTNGFGSAVGSQAELQGQGRRIAIALVWTGLGGGIGAGLLLLGSSDAFAQVVPWLVALSGALLLGRDRLRALIDRRRRARVEAGPDAAGTPAWRRGLPMVLVGVYSGYFGAGAGIMMLAVISLQAVESLAISNAVKNVVTTASNAVAAVIFAFVSPVNWPAAAALALGILIGSACGPAVVRVVDERWLRLAIGLGSFGLAAVLALGLLG